MRGAVRVAALRVVPKLGCDASGQRCADQSVA